MTAIMTVANNVSKNGAINFIICEGCVIFVV